MILIIRYIGTSSTFSLGPKFKLLGKQKNVFNPEGKRSFALKAEFEGLINL
jgi:hypothetical protein